MSFGTQYFPIIFGLLLTMLISSVRYFLTLKSAKNIQVSKTKVTQCVFAIFCIFSLAAVLWWTIHIMLDVPYAIIVETCFYRTRDPRTLPVSKRIALNFPFLFNIVSLLMDILMLRFLKKTILPTSQTLSTLSGRIHGGIVVLYRSLLYQYGHSGVYVLQGIEKIRHLWICLGNWGNLNLIWQYSNSGKHHNLKKKLLLN